MLALHAEVDIDPSNGLTFDFAEMSVQLMELTEQERLILVGKKDEVRKLSEEILYLAIDPEKNELERKKKTKETPSAAMKLMRPFVVLYPDVL